MHCTVGTATGVASLGLRPLPSLAYRVARKCNYQGQMLDNLLEEELT